MKKPEKKGEKAVSVEKLTVDQLLSQLQTEPPSQEQPFSLLFKAFEKLFLEESVQRGTATGLPERYAAFSEMKNTVAMLSCRKPIPKTFARISR